MFASGAPWWSWNTLWGDNFIGGYSYYAITSPFTWFICLFPRENILLVMIIALYLKFIAAGVTAYSFFKYVGFDKDKCVVGGLCYAASSFFITNLFYYHFCEPIIVFPLLLIAIEKIFRGDKYAITLLAITSFLVVWINYYFALSSFLLGIFYFFARYIQTYDDIKANEQQYLIIFRAFKGVLIGCLLSSLVLLPTILHAAGCGKTSIAVPQPHKIGSVIAGVLEFIRVLIMPKISEHEPDTFYSVPFISQSAFVPIIGAISLYWCILHVRDRTTMSKMGWLSWLIIILSLICITPLNGIFTGFTQPAYCRWLYGLDILLIYAFLLIVSDNKISNKQYWGYVVCVIAVLLIIKTLKALVILMHNSFIDYPFTEIEIVGVVLLIVNMVFLGVFVRIGNIKALSLFVACAGALNLMAATHKQFRCKDYDSDYLKTSICDNILTYNDSLFEYRTDFKTKYQNIATLKNRPSVMSYHSISNKRVDELLSVISNNIVSGHKIIHRNRTTFDVLMSVNEFVDYYDEIMSYIPDAEPMDMDSIDNSAIESIESTELFTRYRFKYYIPMGFCYDSYVTHDEFNEYLATCPKDSVMPLLENLVIEPEDVPALSKHLRHAKINPNATLDSLTQERRKYCATSFVGDTRGCKLTTNFDEERVMFLSVVADPGFTATIDGVKTKIYTANLGLSAIVVPKGKHYIDFDYETPGLKLGCIISLCALLILLIIAYAERKQVKTIKTE
jgi:uncharacterized membrane protein YfhO